MLYKKDFKTIAEIIKGNIDFIANTKGHCYNCKERAKNIADELADYLSTKNPNFNRDKFLVACGVN